MRRFCVLLAVLFLVPTNSRAQAPDPTKLTLERIFNTSDFGGDHAPGLKWLEQGGYVTLEPAAANKAWSDLVRYDAAGKKEVLVAADKLIPPGAKEPLGFGG